MKFLIFVLAVVALLWLLRSTRRRVQPPPAPKAPDATEPQSMVRCEHCGVHLPQGEALPGRGGVFCGEPHRMAYEKAHPAP